MQKKILVSVITMLFVISACAPAAPTHEAMMETPTEAMMDKPTDDMMGTPTEEMMATTTEAMEPMATEAMEDKAMVSPDFIDASLTNIGTGESFKISDFAGKVVLIENLAMWCPTCLKQQEQVKLLHEQLGEDSGLVSIGFDVDQNEKAEDLKKYIEGNGFDWYYAIPSLEVVREIANLYGANFLNPPMTPVLIVDRHGVVHPMNMGLKSAEDLKMFIEPFLSEGM